ncbi:MAG: polyprenyl synthetase family protein [Oscillospiraceae bacterium]|nr:polyprenyl synthetase family protein [Oscillospiraceae bacterium]
MIGYKTRVDAALGEYFTLRGEELDGLREAMRYSLLSGGKRVRAALVLAFAKASGGSEEEAMPAACAVEMLHAYSLIHDDLPCMDDDDMRRGKPTNHIVFGECTATLAGDALQAEAFRAILRSGMAADRRAECAAILADAVGSEGMCGGQFLDMLGEDKESQTVAELEDLHSRKTGALIAAACMMGAASAGADEEKIAAAREYGYALGQAFQIRDDVLDKIASAAELGKPIGSDEESGKTTYLTLFGEEKCGELVAQLTAKAKNALSAFNDIAFLEQLADDMAVRMM